MAHYEMVTRMGNVGRENNFNVSNNLLYMHFLDTMSSPTSDLSSSRSRLSCFCFLSKYFLLLPWWMLCMPRKQILMDFPSKQVQEARMRSIASWLQHTSGAYMDLRYSVLSLRGDIFASGVGGERPSMRIAEGRNLKRIPLHILCLHANRRHEGRPGVLGIDCLRTHIWQRAPDTIPPRVESYTVI